MNISVNNDLLVTYTCPPALVEQYKYYLQRKSNKDSFLTYAIKLLNVHFYGNDTDRYYTTSLGDARLT